MARFALTVDGQLVKLQDHPARPDDIPHKGVVWLPCPAVARPAYDSATETVEGPTYQVGIAEVTEVWAKRTLTAEELDARKEAMLDAIDRLNLLVNFDQENRIRALESKAPITAAQYRAALKARL